MRKLCVAVALGLAAMAADAATNGNSVRALGTPSTTSALTMSSSSPTPTASTSTSTGGTTSGGSTGSTTTTTTTTTAGATSNTALSGTLTNGASLGAVTGSTANALGSTLTNGSSLSSGGNAAAAAATGTGTDTTTTNGGVAGIITVDNGLGAVANGINANGEVVGSTLQQQAGASLPQQQVFVQQQSALAPELTALERRELRKRNNVPRNGQLLNSVAPRTNVDRTWQMPDDPPSPALSTSPLR